MKYLKKYNESLLQIEQPLMYDIYDISHEIRDLGYTVSYQWCAVDGDTNPYMLIEWVDKPIKNEEVKDAVDRVVEVSRDYGWRHDINYETVPAHGLLQRQNFSKSIQIIFIK